MKEPSIAFRQASHFQLDDPRMELLVTACRIHNGAPPQTDPTLAVCLDADRLDFGRVGITPDPLRLSTSTAKSIASGHHSGESLSARLFSLKNSPERRSLDF
jgi:hypothetical protein